MNFSGLRHYIAPLILASGVHITQPLNAQTQDRTQRILRDAVGLCIKDPRCNAEKEFFMKNDPIFRPEFEIDEYDRARMEEAFALGWKEGVNDRNAGKITKKGWVDDVDQEKAGWVDPWGNAAVLFNIDNYPCTSQCKETRSAAYKLLEYTFGKGLSLRQAKKK